MSTRIARHAHSTPNIAVLGVSFGVEATRAHHGDGGGGAWVPFGVDATRAHHGGGGGAKYASSVCAATAISARASAIEIDVAYDTRAPDRASDRPVTALSACCFLSTADRML